MFREEEQMYQISLILAVAPALWLLYYMYRLDEIEKEPIGLLAQLFILGAVSIVVAFILEKIGFSILNRYFDEDELISIVISNFFIIGVVEEMTKRFILKAVTWNHPAFDYCFDGVVYAVAVSLGFAALENLLYVHRLGIGVVPLRTVTAIPVHCITGIFMGHYYGLAKLYRERGNEEKKKSYLAKSYCIPVLLHGAYDFIASIGGWGIVVFWAFLIVLDVVAYFSVKRFSREDVTVKKGV